MRFLSGGGLLAAALVAIVAAGVLLPERSSAQAAEVMFRATVTNASNPEMVITPGAILVHESPDNFWAEGVAANLSLERIAEIGDSGEAVEALGATAIDAAPLIKAVPLSSIQDVLAGSRIVPGDVLHVRRIAL